MTGDRALRALLRRLAPERQGGVWAFATAPAHLDLARAGAVATVHEREGLSVVLPEAQARALGLAVAFRCAWITLTVDSALDAVGLTAAVAGALAADGVACNVVAGVRHDHLFVPVDRADDALRCLVRLQRAAAADDPPRSGTDAP